MRPTKRFSSLLTITWSVTAAAIALGTVATPTQAGSVSLGQSSLLLAQFNSNGMNPIERAQPGMDGTVPAPATPSDSNTPVETLPTTPGLGTTLPDSPVPSPAPPLFDSGSEGLGSNQTLPQRSTEPNPVINNGVIPDREPAPIQPFNNLPNNNVPDPRQNVPNQSIDTTPDSTIHNQNVPNQSY